LHNLLVIITNKQAKDLFKKSYSFTHAQTSQNEGAEGRLHYHTSASNSKRKRMRKTGNRRKKSYKEASDDGERRVSPF